MNFILHPWRLLVLALAGWVNREQIQIIEYLKEENHCLREQINGKRLRFTDKQRRRLAVRAKALGRKALLTLETIVTPDTLLRWRRQLIAQMYDGSARRKSGRPLVQKDIRELVILMARQNPRWGYTRIVGAINNLGHEVARTSVANILVEHGLEPAPERSKKTTWPTFFEFIGTLLRQPTSSRLRFGASAVWFDTMFFL